MNAPRTNHLRRAALLREMERETRHIPDAPPADDTEEILPFGDPRTLTPKAQGAA